MKIKTLLIGFPFLMASCQHEGVHAYHIQGTIDDAENGTVVMLQLDKEQDIEILEQTEIQNHQFTFNGVQDSVTECNITYLHNGKRLGATFFLESGNIRMDLSKETSYITGTPNNDRYQHFLNKINAIYAQIGSIYNHSSEDSEHEASEQDLKIQIEGLNKQADQLIATTIQENISNPVGYYLFCRFNQNLTPEQQEEFINKLPIQFRRTAIIEDIRAQLSILPVDTLRTDSILNE